MSSPESTSGQNGNKGGNTLGFTTRGEGASRPEIPGVDTFPGRTVPKDLPGPRKKGRWQELSGKTKLLIATGGALAVAASGGVAIETISPVREAVHRTIGLGGTEVPLTFDDNAEKIIMGDNNITRITPEEAGKEGLLKPKIDLERKTITAPIPFTIPAGTTATVDKTPYKVRGIEQNEPRIVLPENSQSIFEKGRNIILIKGGAGGGANPNAIYTIIEIYPDPNNIGLFLQSQTAVVETTSNIRTEKPSLSPDEYLALLKKYNWDISKLIQDESVLKSDGKTPMATVVGGSQGVHLYDTVFQGPKTDYAGEVVKGMEREFTTFNDKILMATP